jgi:hypothetical protein
MIFANLPQSKNSIPESLRGSVGSENELDSSSLVSCRDGFLEDIGLNKGESISADKLLGKVVTNK